MGNSFQCTKCGTFFAAGSVRQQPPAISTCTVCGASLLVRDSARDAVPSKKGEFWFWASNFGEVGLWIVVVLVLGAALSRLA